MKSLLLIFLAIVTLSCTQKTTMQFKYADKEQTINCDGQNNALLNEALHSFEQDLLDHVKTENKTLTTAYGQYLYQGMSGTALFNEIANDHSLAIRDQLLQENIITTDGVKSNLNYEHPAVKCIIEGIEDAGIKKTISALLEVNSMDPKLFNSRIRNFGRQSQSNRNQAMYIALDSYYQNLVGMTLEEPSPNE